jgi:UDP-N-acetylmuramoylalanine--D-glutamate ligase
MDNSKTSKITGTGNPLVQARQQALAAGPHRMEVVASVEEVIYINDSRSTFLDASLASLGQVDRPMVWIAGAWSDDMGEGHMQELMRERVKAVVLYGERPPVEPALEGTTFYVADDLRMAVFLAHELALPGEAVLFSPACPSGNGFANYEERGAAFKHVVREL